MCDVLSNRCLLIIALIIFAIYIVEITYIAYKTRGKQDHPHTKPLTEQLDSLVSEYSIYIEYDTGMQR